MSGGLPPHPSIIAEAVADWRRQSKVARAVVILMLRELSKEHDLALHALDRAEGPDVLTMRAYHAQRACGLREAARTLEAFEDTDFPRCPQCGRERALDATDCACIESGRV